MYQNVFQYEVIKQELDDMKTSYDVEISSLIENKFSVFKHNFYIRAYYA